MSKFNNLQRLDTNLLLVFIDLCETRSVTLTSERMFLTQSAVSHALKRLRLALDDDIFTQSRAGLQPTPRARKMLQPIASALQEINMALAAPGPFDPSVSTQQFRIGMSEIMELSIAPLLVQEVRKAAPGVTLNLLPISDPRVTSQRLESGDIQLIVSARTVASAGVQTITAGTMPFAAMLPKHMSCGGTTMPLDVYLSVPHVIIHPPDHRGSVIDHALARLGRRRIIGAVVQNYSVMAEVAARCGFICHLPGKMIAQYASSLGLKAYELPVETPPIRVILTSHPRFRNDKSVEWLKDKTTEIVSSLTVNDAV
ncbi:LysR substrate-binding domain-containing protein [Pusillimonas sp. SM2304]|uniref:LysR family transcriptional regulator n=1 Tax=Pusillimonas sp. SM2304 TaxID=3073241 RepID=UPI00287515A8|nr:LysR substrate-binding domain-containing protein [Pusillimonas sp. SM2304]MDS1139904.1 LysR substrate-binding domain-containing protein [Pusillimonas sp. SM2304]